MIGRVNQQKKHGAPPADLLVCFPSRAHLTLIPKKLSSPARLMDVSFHHPRNNQLKKLPSTRFADSRDMASKATSNSDDVSEPSSPKVTCAGQIKVRPGRSAAAASKSWQSVMEEIERIHKKSKNERKKKKSSWGDALWIKKDVMQFLTCLKNIKLDFRCFGAVPECDFSSDEDDEEDEADVKKKDINHNESESADKYCKEEETITSEKNSRSMFSDWFMVVQDMESEKDAAELDQSAALPPPPPNALLLMRCKSAPAKSWLENKAKLIVEEEEEKDHSEAHTHQEEEDQKVEELEAEEEEDQDDDEAEKVGRRKKLREYVLVMEQYDTDFYKLSNDIAKETWVVGSIINPFSRSSSCKR